MPDSLAGVVLAAGAGTRLAPLTQHLPKALCPVGGRPLVDLALDRVAAQAGSVAVNTHDGGAALAAHLAGRVHVSVEEPVALGTAGALGQLRSWLDGRSVLLTNADAWLPPEADEAVADLVAAWDGQRVRLLCVVDPAHGDFGDLRYCGVAVLPWREVAPLAPVPSGLYEMSWRALAAADHLDLAIWDGRYFDCGTPADYLAANMAASGGASVVDPGADVDPAAVLERCVVWAGSRVGSAEVLRDAVRTPRLTLLVRPAQRAG